MNQRSIKTRVFKPIAAGLILLPLLLACSETDEPAPIEQAENNPEQIKAVILTMFENGEPVGDDAGELQFWVERSDIKQELDFPLGEYPLFLTQDNVLIICLGGGIPNATASVMALGLDTRFDLSDAYWIITGISGGDPEDVSLGSAVWATSVVDGDLVYEIDAREIPDHWPYGYIPLGAKEPAQGAQDVSDGWTLDTISFALNEPLANWAYEMTVDVSIPDMEGIIAFRELYEGYPNAQKPPFVTMGETLSASTYWHGELLNQWANDWIKVYAGDDKNFMTSNMEDSGTLTALYRLARLDLVDTDRVMVLRTVSNFSMPPKGEDAAWSTTADYPDDGLPALEAAYLVANEVLQELISSWDMYQTQIPQ